MDMRKAHPGTFLKAADVIGDDRTMQVADVEMQTVGEEEKPVMTFKTGEQIVLNKTNTSILIDAWGHESKQWKGLKLTLYADKVQYQGRLVDGLRVRPQKLTGAKAKGQAEEELNDAMPDFA